MLFFLEKYVKTCRKNFSLSSKISLNFFLFSHTKNSIFLGLVSKRGIFSRVGQATLLQSIRLPILLSPEQYWSTVLPPCNSFPFLQWWFVTSKVMSGVLRFIQVKSEFSYDLFLQYWLKFNLFESCLFSKRLVNIHQVNLKKKINCHQNWLTSHPPHMSYVAKWLSLSKTQKNSAIPPYVPI